MQLIRQAWVFLFVAMLAGSARSSDETLPPVRFQGKDTLLRPERYREWIFVGSSLGLSYQQNPGGDGTTQHNAGLGLYHNVYIQPSSYKAFASSGRFPEGTVLVLELVTADVKKDPRLRGSYQNEFVALEAAVKDSNRFPEGWAYFSFEGPDGKPVNEARPFPKERCWSCHAQKAATDNVFTQFYPVLRAAAPKP